MKSIVQEASTIAKAVEQAWKIAGSPQEFSVKVLEQPVYNIFGFTKRSAKIAVLFDNEPKREASNAKGKQGSRAPYFGQSAPAQQAQQNVPQRRVSPASKPFQRENRESQPSGFGEQKKAAPQQSQPRPVANTVQEGMWNEELVKSAREWLTEVFALMGMREITFKTEIQNFNLLVVLSGRLAEDPTREKHLLASLSTLLIATLKRQYRKALRGHKVILSHT